VLPEGALVWGFGEIEAAYDRRIAAWRRRSAKFDHFWRARQRYIDALGGRLAAAIAYHAFFAAFALALVAYSVLGFLLEFNLDLVTQVDRFLRQNLPWLNSNQIKGSRGTVGVIGLVGVVLTGIGWIEALRSSQRQIWQVPQQPGNPIIRRLIDLGMLVGLFVLIGASLLAVDAIEAGLEWLEGSSDTLALTLASWTLTIALNVVLAAALLVAIPRLKVPVRRLIPSLILVGAGITLLNTVGRYFIARSASGPVYQVVAGTVGLLVYLYLFNQLLLFSAALAATGSAGDVVDLATRQPLPTSPAEPPPASGPPSSPSSPPGLSPASGSPAAPSSPSPANPRAVPPSTTQAPGRPSSADPPVGPPSR
jgi:membrane protein